MFKMLKYGVAVVAILSSVSLPMFAASSLSEDPIMEKHADIVRCGRCGQRYVAGTRHKCPKK